MRMALKGAVVAGLVALGAAAQADDRAIVQSLYENVLSHAAAPDLAQRAAQILSPDWTTRGNNTGGGRIADFLRNVQGFGAAIPDLRWQVVEIVTAGDRYVVRGRATGTPARPLFGIEPAGRSFDIMSIDIHTVREGRIIETYHLEDWAGAMRQLRGQ